MRAMSAQTVLVISVPRCAQEDHRRRAGWRQLCS
jgi:hypothetical protein